MLYVKDIVQMLDATVLYIEDMDTAQVQSVCGSDMMSDVLAYVKDQSVLMTGLCNPQTIRTAEMMDMVCIVFVRNKQPDETMIELARQRGISIFYDLSYYVYRLRDPVFCRSERKCLRWMTASNSSTLFLQKILPEQAKQAPA